MKSFITSLLLASTYAQVYTQYNYYPLAKCSGQPVYMSSVQGGQCLVQNQAATCSALGGGGSVYQSQNTLCSTKAMNMDGIVQLYVASSVWTSSGTCEGSPAQVEIMMADANCHPAAAKDGLITSYFSVNCNGGKPIYKTCKDSGCSDCTESASSGECDLMGALSSKKVECIWPGGKKGKGGAIDDDSSATISGVPVVATLILMSMILAY